MSDVVQFHQASPTMRVKEGNTNEGLLAALLELYKTNKIQGVVVVMHTEEGYYSYQSGCESEDVSKASRLLDQWSTIMAIKEANQC